MIDSLTRPRIKWFRLTSDIQVTGSRLVMSSYLLVYHALRDSSLICDYPRSIYGTYILYVKKYFQASPRLYINSYLRKFSNIRHFKKSTVYCARYGRPDRYMRSSESEGFDNSMIHRYKTLECLKNISI